MIREQNGRINFLKFVNVDKSQLKSKLKLEKEKKVRLTGTIIAELPGMLYKVEALFEHKDDVTGEKRIFKPIIECGVSGRIKKMFIQLKKGDEVQIEVSLYNIDRGTIVYRNTKRKSHDEVLEDNI